MALLFVAGWHESFGEWEEKQGFGRISWLDSLMLLVGRTGAFAAVNYLFPPPRPSWCESETQWRWIACSSSSGRFFRTMHRETRAYQENDAFLVGENTSDFPVGCLVCADSLNAAEAPPDYPCVEHNAAWLHACSRLAEVSSNSQITVINEHDHMFLLQHPEIVVNELQVLAARTNVTARP
jgi:pimeloyl-ACP methyl ester carboxylesterase